MIEFDIDSSFKLFIENALELKKWKSYSYKPAQKMNRLQWYRDGYKTSKNFNFLKPLAWNYIPIVNVQKVEKIIVQSYAGQIVPEKFTRGKLYKMSKAEKLKRQMIQYKKGLITLDKIKM